MIYRYTARTTSGDVVRGSLEAATVDALLDNLRTRALFVTAVDRENSLSRPLRLSFRATVKRRALLAFFRSFSTLIRAGVPIRRSLETAIARCDDTVLLEALRGILAEIEQGGSLSAAMQRRPRVFPALYIAMIAAGEEGGILDDVLERLATFLERDAALRKSVAAALAYPAVVLTASIALVIFLIARIVPMFSSLFDSFHVELPWTTKTLLLIGELISRFDVDLTIVSVVVGGIIAVSYARRTPRGATVLDRLRLSIPIAGPLLRKAITARLARMLGTLLRSGVDLVRAIDVVRPVAGSPLFAAALDGVGRSLREGEALSPPLTAARVFDPMFLALVAVGEETGLVDEMLFKAAEYFEGDVEAAIATLGAVIEPLLIMALGVIVGFIVFSIFIPLYSLIGSVSK